jgi:hypothetical protein
MWVPGVEYFEKFMGREGGGCWYTALILQGRGGYTTYIGAT